MQLIRQKLKPAGLVLAIFTLMISGPIQSANAALIGTETVLDSTRGQQARTYLKQLLARGAIQEALVAYGIDNGEARARIDSLSDAEAIKAADRFEQMPVGSGPFETIVVIAFLVFLILLITDIAGYTDVFPFVN